MARSIPVGKARAQKFIRLQKVHTTAGHSYQGQAALQGHHRQQPQVADFARLRYNCKFAVVAPDKARLGDATYIATDESWLYLAVVIDLFSRKVVGWSLQGDVMSSIVIDALRMAWFRRHPGKPPSCCFAATRAASMPVAPSRTCSRITYHEFDESAWQLLG